MIRVAAMLTCLALAGCSAAQTTETQAVDLGAEVTLAPGATVSVKRAEMKVRFVAVIDDSRCPRDVTCIWAGEVKVQLEISRPAQEASLVEIAEGGSSTVSGYRLTVLKVEPQPMSTARIPPQEYRVTLKIDAAG